MEKKLLKKGDIVLIFAALLLCAALFLCINVFNKNYGEFVQIEVGGNVEAVLPINKDASYDVMNSGKITNTVKIENGAVSVSYADCKDQICAEHKKISKVNESIICLPNKVVVTVISADGAEDFEIDGVV